MRLLVDAQLPPALARWFGERGIAATAVRQLGLRDSDDGSIWNFATEGGWTVVTGRDGEQFTQLEDFVSQRLQGEAQILRHVVIEKELHGSGLAI